ncbi:MAG: hypothetical protein M1826_006346 [Phylliscum demangeonii]|nr:MAG: hypothetical protein M1826_006346 [Phylliscum demangeonii]
MLKLSLPRTLPNGDARLLIVVPLSLLVVWTLAWLLPSPAHIQTQISSRIPTVKIDYHPHRDPRSNWDQSRVAVLVEARPLGQLSALLLHMISVVPPEWRFVYLGSAASVAVVNASLPVQLHQATGKLEVRVTPPDLPAESGADINKLLTSKTFYNDVIGFAAEWLLVFHADSILCANSRVSLDDWVDQGWDWVGAPWQETDNYGGHGGLSLRRVSRIRRLLEFQATYPDSGAEDRWLVDRLALMPGARMANASVEGAFCVGDIWHHQPLGYHLGHKALHAANIGGGGGPEGPDENLRGSAVWQDMARRLAIYEYCPEIKLIMEMKLERQRCEVAPPVPVAVKPADLLAVRS